MTPLSLPADIARRILAVAVERALAGDVAMLRALLPYCMPPPRREPVVRVDMPALATPADAVRACAAIAAATADGRITPSEAAGLAATVGNFLKAIETADMERRLAALEDKLKVRARNAVA